MPKPTTFCKLCGHVSAPDSDYCEECKQMDDRIRHLMVIGAKSLPLYLSVKSQVCKAFFELQTSK